MVFHVSLEMQSDSKNYISVQDGEMTELVHTINSRWSISGRGQNCSLNSHRKPRRNVLRVFDVC